MTRRFVIVVLVTSGRHPLPQFAVIIKKAVPILVVPSVLRIVGAAPSGLLLKAR